MLRSIAAIVFGFVFIAALSFGADAALKAAMPSAFSASGRVESIPMLLLIQAYVLIFAVSGCYLTARLAPNRPLRHALILGLLGLAFNIAGTIAMWDTAPAWYHVVALALVMPAAWLGGRLRELQLQRTAAPIPAA
jgi:hypothetical protein